MNQRGPIRSKQAKREFLKRKRWEYRFCINRRQKHEIYRRACADLRLLEQIRDTLTQCRGVSAERKAEEAAKFL